MLTGKKRKYEQVEEDGSSDSCDALDEVPRALDQAERVRIDGIAAEHLTLLKVSALFLGNSTMTASAS